VECGCHGGESWIGRRGKEVRVMRTEDSEDCVRSFSFENRTSRDRWGWNVAHRVETTWRWWGDGEQCGDMNN
jgi:hypothetical protein